MDVAKFYKFLTEQYNIPFKGWDFSYITESKRMVQAPLDWSFASSVLKYLQNCETMLDIGTGGGEFLSLLQPLPLNTFATESDSLMVEEARKNLKDQCVTVVEAQNNDHLPFNNNYFDLITARHEYYHPLEIHRILKPKSYFITQQVGGNNLKDLNNVLNAPENPRWKQWNKDYASMGLEKKGIKIIESYEEYPITRFYDVGALVYYLKAVPWQIPNFSVRRYFEPLKKVAEIIKKNGYFDVTSHRFLLIGIKI